MDRRFVVDYLCKNEDVPTGTSENRINSNVRCRARLLIDIAMNLGISEQKIQDAQNRDELCIMIHTKIVELDIAANLANCKKSIMEVQMANMASADPNLLKDDFDELMRWYNDIFEKADATVRSNNLQKMTEMRNQIKGSCGTFTTGLMSKLNTNKTSSSRSSFSSSKSGKSSSSSGSRKSSFLKRFF